jgi:hypothetical protein
MATPRRTPPPSGPQLDKALDEAFPPAGPVVSAPPAVDLPTPASLDEALALFQANCPAVARRSEGVAPDRNGNRTYKYANLGDIHAAALPLLGRLGLSWRCKPTLTEQGFGLVYVLKHVSGDLENGFWPLGDPTQIRPQAMGSLLTYAKRYAFCAVTGIAPAEDDDDGKAAQEEASRREQQERDERNWSRQRPTEAPKTEGRPASTGRHAAPAAPDELAGLTMAELSRAFWKIDKPKRTGAAPIYGAEWARRVGALETPDALDAMYAEINALTGGDHSKFSAYIPWSHNGSSAVDLLTTRRGQILAAQEAANQESAFGEQIAAAMTPERLDEIEAAMLSAQARGGLTQAQLDRLRAFALEREGKLRPAGPPAAPPAQEPDGDDPWATASVPDDSGSNWTEPSGASDGEAPAPPERSASYDLHFAIIWKGGALGETQGKLDGAVERGELSQDEYSDLSVMLADRPAERVTMLIWRAEVAPSLIALDALRDEMTDMRAKDRISEPDGRKVYAAITRRRLILDPSLVKK